MIILPEEIHNATKRASAMAISYKAEKASHKEIHEAPIERANRRTDEAENRLLTDTAKLKAAHANDINALCRKHQAEIERLNAIITGLRDA